MLFSLVQFDRHGRNLRMSKFSIHFFMLVSEYLLRLLLLFSTFTSTNNDYIFYTYTTFSFTIIFILSLNLGKDIMDEWHHKKTYVDVTGYPTNEVEKSMRDRSFWRAIISVRLQESTEWARYSNIDSFSTNCVLAVTLLIIILSTYCASINYIDNEHSWYLRRTYTF